MEIVSSASDLFRRGTDFFPRDRIKNGRYFGAQTESSHDEKESALP
jgi:hypothetical protein